MTNIADTIKNARHPGAHNPFARKPQKAKTMPHATTQHIDPATLVICNDALPSHRAKAGRKYADLFKDLKHGQAVKCKPEHVGQLSGALRKWIEDGHTTGMVRSMRDYGDGLGRVWLLADAGKN